MEYPHPFFHHPPPQTGGNMKSRKFTPPGAERDEELRQTVISCITQKLQRMSIDQLREILRVVTKAVEGKK